MCAILYNEIATLLGAVLYNEIFFFFGIDQNSLFPFFLSMTNKSTHEVLGQAGIYRAKNL